MKKKIKSAILIVLNVAYLINSMLLAKLWFMDIPDLWLYIIDIIYFGVFPIVDAILLDKVMNDEVILWPNPSVKWDLLKDFINNEYNNKF